MSAERLGRFIVERPLAEGGMSATSLGLDPESGARVVLKTLMSADPVAGLQLRREARRLAGLSHPGVVRFVAQGEHAGLPWYAMEWLPGGSLQEHIPSPGSPLGPEALRARLRWIARICEALGYLHGRGVVHGDLSPRNVLFRAPDAPVIADFGLASRFGEREMLQVDGGITATPMFASPEQLRGEGLDGRSDIYALGCLLFALLTGTPPFIGEVDEVVRQHLSATPPRLSERDPGLPPALDALARRMLTRDRRDRPGYVVDIAAALAPWTGLTPSGSRAYLYRAELVGRDGELRSLRALAQEARSAKGRVVLIRGESGVGKTRLVQEAAATLPELGFMVSAGACRPDGGPLHPLRPHLQLTAAIGAGAPDFLDALGFRLPLLAQFEPALASLTRSSLEDVSERARGKVTDAACFALTALAKRRPTTLVLDDVQWADPLTAGTLQALCADGWLDDVPLLVVLTARSEEPTEALRALASHAAARTLNLGRLDPAPLAELVSELLAVDAPPEDMIAFLAEASEGNPFHVGEYLRAAIDSGLLQRRPLQGWAVEGAGGARFAELPLPRTLQALIQGRLARLTPDAREALELACVQGRQVSRALLGRLLPEPSAKIEALLAEGWLEETRADDLRFVHDKLREGAYDALPDDARRGLHRRVAEALEQLRSGEAGWRLGAAGQHWAAAGEPSRAAPLLIEAADLARSQFANRHAIQLYEAARAQLDAAGLEGPLDGLLWDLGETLARVQEREQAEARYREALGRLAEDAPAQRGELLRRLSRVRESQFRYPEALEILSEAQQTLEPHIAQDPEALQVWLRVLLSESGIRYWRSDIPGLEAVIARMAPALSAETDPELLARFHHAATLLGFRRTDYAMDDLTRREARAAHAHALSAGQLELSTVTRYTLGMTLLFSEPATEETLREAEAHLSGALEMAQQSGDAFHRALCLAYLGFATRRLRDVDATRRHVEALLRHEPGGMFTMWTALGHANGAWVAMRDNDHDGARAHIAETMAHWARMPIPYPFRWVALLPRLELELGAEAPWGETIDALMAPGTHRMPEALTAALREAREALAEDPRGAEDLAWDALDLAEALRF